MALVATMLSIRPVTLYFCLTALQATVAPAHTQALSCGTLDIHVDPTPIEFGHRRHDWLILHTTRLPQRKRNSNPGSKGVFSP